MNRPVIAHEVAPRVSGKLSLAADIAYILPEYRHVLVCGTGLDQADPRLDMWLFSMGMDSVYGRRDMTRDSLCALRYSDLGVHVRSDGRSGLVRMENAPIVSRLDRCRTGRRTFRKFRVGLLFGQRTLDGAAGFIKDMLSINEEAGSPLKFLTTAPEAGGPSPISGLDDRDCRPALCSVAPGAMELHLGQCNVLAMPDRSVPDRIRLEAMAAGVPVVTGPDAETVSDKVMKLAGNREDYERARHVAFREGCRHDLAFGIVKLKSQLRKIHQWRFLY